MSITVNTHDEFSGELDNSRGAALINAAQFAKLLSISERTLYRLKSSKRLPASINLGGSVRWRRTDVDRWIERGCQPPNAT
jgi:excisionase family DNA binding protein